MAIPTLIFCGGNNKRFAEIASSCGWQLGARCGDKVYFPIYFADQNWKKANKQKYVTFIKEHQPYIATVLDWTEKEKLNITLSWAEEISPFVQKIVIIPKVVNAIEMIPKIINNKEIILGYSVPTQYGKTITPIWEFSNRKTHLLGGSTQKQYELTKYLNVVSLDGNMMMKMANKYCSFWQSNKTKSKYGHWPQLQEIGLGNIYNGTYKAFELSCQNIMQFWQGVNN